MMQSKLRKTKNMFINPPFWLNRTGFLYKMCQKRTSQSVKFARKRRTG